MKKEFLETPFKNRINSIYSTYSTDSEEHWRRNNNHTIYKPGDFDYRFNNYGFRCDNFDHWTNHKFRILFAGCSLTEGVGLPLEDTWAKVFHNMICKELETDIPFWSIAAAATGTDQMLRYMYHFSDMLRPQVVISYLPYVQRRERWGGDCLTILEKKDRAFTDENYIQYQTEKNLALINNILECIDSYMLYTPCDWGYDFEYMNLSRIEQISDPRFQIIREEGDYARDGYHPGPNDNKAFATKMFEQCWPTVKNKIGFQC